MLISEENDKQIVSVNVVVELLTRVLCDSLPENSVDGIYLFCQTEDNQGSVLQAALSLLNRSMSSKVLILHSEAKSGFPGFANWNEHLSKLGISSGQIQGVPIGRTAMLNTLVESEALVQFVHQRKLKSLIVVAPPFQQLRAFMTVVTVALEKFPQLLIYSYPAVAMPWQQEVVHSQGTLRTTRQDLIQTELERIHTYQKKGDLASFEQVMTYLNNRETVASK